ncbi:histidine--tRNA ligase [Sphingomonas lacunae]|uniref:Histidine--tRNA ligase n=1 Tax=Sphingomonas lacunae TaxID=2698828 RepID=A0A6M4ASH9_9SPHN|nr:histidine--tRNA ligase [Sphingomonas lacunae]QJQ32023.1 histidine--tRNA ligase [Sphingomonas lacunae]
MKRIETPKPVRGTQDMIGETADRFQHVVDTFDRVRRLYGFKRIEVPVIEPTAVFARSLGETTDIVSKEMYTFEDRSGDSVTLRPEFTAGIARAYITNGWQQHAPLKVATHGALFRYERPQKGRYRQFHQLDAEVLGSESPLADVELLAFADQLLKELGITEGVSLHLNTLGDSVSREAWRAALVAHFEAHRGELSEDSLARLARNPLRILDSKDPRDRPAAESAPSIETFLTDEAGRFYEEVRTGLAAAGVAWVAAPRLVRGMDYYRHTAFEFVPDAGSVVADKLGSQSTILGGGRYDGLVETMGGPATPAVGWAAGIERLAMLLEEVPTNPVQVAVVSENDERTGEAVALAAQLRQAGFAAELVASGSAKKRYSRAMALNPLTAISLDVRDGVKTQGLRVIKAETDLAADIQAAFERISLTIRLAP